MEPLTLEQQRQLNSWASKRDSILLEISNAQTEKEKLTIENKALADSNTEIYDKVQQSVGRLIELTKQEEDRGKVISIEVAELITKKSLLQTEVSNLESTISALTDNKMSLIEDSENAVKFHEAVFARAHDVDRIVSETIKINAENTGGIKNILVEAGNELQKIITIAESNVNITNKAIQEIPKIIVDLHKDVLERRKINKIRTI